jgi:uncharacterized membrane protein YuzA (DUF378 family)
MDNKRRGVFRDFYQRLVIDSGPPVIVFTLVNFAAVVVGVVSPAAGLAYLAVGLLAAVVVDFAHWRYTEGDSQPQGEVKY